MLSAPNSTNNTYYRSLLTTSDVEALQPDGNGWSIANEGRSKFGSAAWAGYSNSETGIMHVAANEAVQ